MILLKTIHHLKYLRVKLSLCYFRTALILATKYDAKCIVELLLREGIDAFAEDQSGRNALQHAIASGFNV